ncbi:MAG: Uma2 family endonuclease [Pseudonocardia sp.]|nr:Uma2 family endonuclease [Pseudonocardia sp.]
MTADPLPTRLLTSAEFAALPEMEGRYELQGGNVVMSPSAIPEHQIAIDELATQLRGQVPDGLWQVQAIDIDLELVPTGRPGYVRIPDLVVVTGDGLRRRAREGGIIRAREVVLAVEVLSPGSSRIDRTLKRAEYADAGIPYYWVIDIEGRPTLSACHLAGEFGYADDGPATGTFTSDVPFPVLLDLDALVRP